MDRISPMLPAGALQLVLADPLSLAFMQRLERVAASGAPVLIRGETGTGKELAAREVHARSSRADKPFVAVNAGALPEQLIESELFGHERGAYTGAHERRPGWFESAHGGTLFLDEIGDLPLSLQVKLLRVLSTGEITRLGARKPIQVDVRVVAATNVDLQIAMQQRRFRQDLFYRLSVTELVLPPLRERPGDILPLARHFLQLHAGGIGGDGPQLGADACAALVAHHWPGNVRELENCMQRLAIDCSTGPVTARDLGLPELPARAVAVTADRQRPDPSGLELTDARQAARAVSVPCSLALSSSRSLRDLQTVEQAWATLERAFAELLPCAVPELYARVEAELLAAAYRYSGGNQLETARLLGISRHVARARLLQHGHLSGPRTSRQRPAELGLRPEPRVLRIGYQHLGMLMLIKAQGAFEATLRTRNFSIRWQEYEGGIQIVDALRRGELDLGVVGDSPAVYAQAERVPVVYVASEAPAPNRVALIVPHGSPLRSVRDLRGKRVAVNRVAQAHYLLMLALEEAGLGLDEIELCFQPPALAQASFRTGAIDAWAIWDPWLSSARLDLGARVLRDASGLFDSSVYYLAHERFARTDGDVMAELLKHLRAVSRWVASDPGRAAHLVAPLSGFSARALEASWERDAFTVGVPPEQLAAQQRIADHCLRLRLIPRPVSVASAQWPHSLAG